jgi:hypothetical protein
MTFTLNDARRCADRYVARDRTCDGCRFSAHCGIGERDRAGLVEFLEKVDPGRLNIMAVALAPLAHGEVTYAR